MVVAQGARDASGRCVIGQVDISFDVSPSLPSGSVSLTTDDACQLIVENIQFSTTSKEPSQPREDGSLVYPKGKTAPRDHTQLLDDDIQMPTAVDSMQGWSEAIYEEQFHIDISKVHAQMDYTDDGTSAYSGRNPNAWCWWRSGTGWWLNYCGPYQWDTSGTSEVWIQNEGEFDHSVGPKNWLWAKYRGFPGHNGRVLCTHIATDPPGWSVHCDGGWYQI